MTEVWKDIDGYEGLYQVSNLGNVKSLNYLHTGKEMILNPGLSKGYLKITLCKDGKHKKYYVHRLVAEAFIPNPNGYQYVNHKNEDKQANFVENLEWVSHSLNINYGTRNKRVAEKLSIPIFCVELNKVFPSIIEANRITGISDGNICSCLKGRHKSAGGYHWRYI